MCAKGDVASEDQDVSCHYVCKYVSSCRVNTGGWAQLCYARCTTSVQYFCVEQVKTTMIKRGDVFLS
jgi:hypothetical protein